MKKLLIITSALVIVFGLVLVKIARTESQGRERLQVIQKLEENWGATYKILRDNVSEREFLVVESSGNIAITLIPEKKVESK